MAEDLGRGGHVNSVGDRSATGARIRTFSLVKASARFTIAIGRALGTVVVTVHGELDLASAAHLESVLTDLIDSQPNVALIIDLHDAREGSREAMSIFAGAARLAESRGGSLVLSSAPASIYSALETAGLAGLVSGGGLRTRPAAPSSRNGGRGNHPAGGAQHWSPRSAGPQKPAG